MKSSLSVFFFICLFISCSSTNKLSEVNTDSSIFRYTVLASGDTLFLGGKVGSLSVFGDSLDNLTLRIPMSYPGVESMYVKKNPNDHTIDRQHFVYNSSYEFNRELKSYTEDLGEPDSTKSRSNFISYYWDDGTTHFEMIRLASEGKNHSYSILRNSDALGETSFNTDKIDSYRGNYTVKDIIGRSEVYSMISGLDSDVLLGFSSALPDSILENLTPLVNKHFSTKSLYSHMVDYMSSKSSPRINNSLYEWLFSDWFLKQSHLIKTYTPELSIEEFAASLQNEQPPRERILAFYAFVEANKAGEFFLGIQEASRATSNEIYASLGFTSEITEPISDQEKAQLKQQYNLSILVSFLWAMEPLTKAQIQKMTDAYTSDSGIWYVQTYSDALVYSINRAGEELTLELKESKP